MIPGKIEVENTLRTIFRRCVICPPGAPSCPVCPSDQTCSLNAQSCTECASTTCVQITSLPGQATPQSSVPVGAIAGGVIAGVVVIAALTYLVYRFCTRSRRRDTAWVDQKVEKRDPTTLSRSDRQSTRSVGSIATTVLTRASNVIQIAYIPGITNRTPPDSPAQLIPPVPPLPFGSANTSPASTPHMEQDMHFFMPGDLRDSTYSNMTTEDQRISLAPSLARASVATTIYRGEAVASPMPAQQAFRTKPAVVSVKSGATSPGLTDSFRSHTPPVPQLPKHIGNSSIVARNVTARPIEVKKAHSGTRVPTLGNLARANSSAQQSTKSEPTRDIWEEKEVVFGPSTTMHNSSPVSPMVKPQHSFSSVQSGRSSAVSGMFGSPLREATASPSRHADDGLSSMIEEAMNRAARDPTHSGLGSRPELRKMDSSGSQGPFSDANEVKENVL